MKVGCLVNGYWGIELLINSEFTFRNSLFGCSLYVPDIDLSLRVSRRCGMYQPKGGQVEK
jgi:hypothetical protein